METVKHDICTDFIEIIAGTDNRITSAYTEAVNKVNDPDKSLDYLKNFIKSIENVASKNGAVDKRISDSKGNINDFSGYDNIVKSLKFLSTHKAPCGSAITADLKNLHDCLVQYKSIYMEGYRKNIRLLELEYESATYLLVTGLSMALDFCFEVADGYGGTLKFNAKPKAYFGVTGKKLHEMAEELKKKNHEEYLDQIIKTVSRSKEGTPVNESYYSESADASMSLIQLLCNAATSVLRVGVKGVKTVKNTLFGIVPLIRSVIFLSYKRKADTILRLEENVAFIEQNIEILQNRTNMDPAKKAEIIKKQKAIAAAYKRKAEKYRAQLEEGEKAAASAIRKENQTIGNINKDDDFVLENVSTNTDFDWSETVPISESGGSDFF